MGELLDATRAAVKAAKHLTPMDAGMVEALYAVAQKIDVQDEYFAELEKVATAKRRPPPSMDNVSQPTYLKYCDALGLTPAGRVRLDLKKETGGRGGKLAQLRSVNGKSA